MTRSPLSLNSIVVSDALEHLKSMPDECVDLIITSPPYNKRTRTRGWLVSPEKYGDYDDHMAEDRYQAWQVEILGELLRVTKLGGSLFYNHKHRWIEGALLHPLSWLSRSAWSIKQEIVWDRAIAANMRGWRYWQVDERVYWLYKPANGYLIGKELESRHAKFSSIWRMRPEPRTNAHPAPFPIELPTRIIYSILDSAGVVLDPFCGTGTTLVAAKLLGHDYFGIDISPAYVKNARERLANAEIETPRLRAEIERHVIQDSFVARKKRGTVSWPYGPKPGNKTGEDGEQGSGSE